MDTQDNSNSNSDSLLDRLKILKHVYELFNTQELEFIKERNKKEYHLYPFPKETQEFSFSNIHQPVKLTKYVIQGIGNYELPDSNALELGFPLYNDLSSLIHKELGDNYVIIFCRATDSYIHHMEIFGVKFYNLFNKGEFGTIVFDQSYQKKYTNISMNQVQLKDGQVQFEIDLVYPKAMTYQGSPIKDKNILFYGFDVETNRYLSYFFTKNQAKAILNIIPYRTNSFLHDNVD